MNMTTTTDELRSRNLRTVFALAALFMLPLITSFALYYAGWRPQSSASHGELIQPPRPLKGAESVFADQWTLVYVGSGRCDEACRQSLYVMRQTRLALGKEMARVKRVFLASAECCDRSFVEREHTGLVVLDGADEPYRSLLRQFPAQDRAHMLYVVDPLGNLMMRYDARQNPKGLLQDLKRLLKLSHIG